ncbi:MAG: hypothetical protein DSY80_04830 [Desulfocapsa sp.]|nr:MAG: hypothetical protein DSY80_04830 [Desulfocapsa sp.]
MAISTYQFGVRIDKDSETLAWEQIKLARRLYNEIIAIQRQAYCDAQDFVYSKLDSEGKNIFDGIKKKNDEVREHKANFDDANMKVAIEDRSKMWKALSPLLKKARKEHRAEITEKFWSRLKTSASSEIGLLGKFYINQEGLGWATASDIIKRTSIAWSKSMTKGKPPQFSKASETIQDSLTLQFTAKGGCPFDAIKKQKSGFLKIHDYVVGRQYGEFSFRLGLAKNNNYANGTIQMHREPPKGSSVKIARLICRKVANKETWKLQLVLDFPDAEITDQSKRKPLVVVHMGWNMDVSGRRIAGITDESDSSCAEILQLPQSVEDDIKRADAIKSKRDKKRDEIVARIKKEIPDIYDEDINEELDRIKHLPVQHVAISRLHRFIQSCIYADIKLPDWLIVWKSKDKIKWQAHAGIANNARARRKQFYIDTSIRLASNYKAVVLEDIDLAEAAKKINDKGERSEFKKKARSGRFIASLFTLKEELRKQCDKHHTALFEQKAETVSTCANCESKEIKASADDYQELICGECGSHIDRKANGAAILYQINLTGIEQRTKEYHSQQLERKNQKAIAQAKALLKKQEANRKRIAEKNKA